MDVGRAAAPTVSSTVAGAAADSHEPTLSTAMAPTAGSAATPGRSSRSILAWPETLPRRGTASPTRPTARKSDVSGKRDQYRKHSGVAIPLNNKITIVITEL